MRIRDVGIGDVATGRNWRLLDSSSPSMVEWEIDDLPPGAPTPENVVYSALAVFENGEVRPLLLIREPTTYEWWGDTCEYVDGAWRQVGETAIPDELNSETYVANPLSDDLSFMGGYSHDLQRKGFSQWRQRLIEG